jgi:predicted neuraminidase
MMTILLLWVTKILNTPRSMFFGFCREEGCHDGRVPVKKKGKVLHFFFRRTLVAYLGLGILILDGLCPIVSRAGAGFGRTRTLNSDARTEPAGKFDVDPHVLLVADGRLRAVWQSFGGQTGSDSDILFAHSSDGGHTWRDPQPLNLNAYSDQGPDTGPRIATNGKGRILCAWQSRETFGGELGLDSDILYSISENNGDDWSFPRPINTTAAVDSGDDGGRTIFYVGAETWVVLWYSNDTLIGTVGGDDDIFIAISSDDGLSWSYPRALNSNATLDSGDDRSPELLIAPDGRWLAVWVSQENIDAEIGSDWDILFALSGDRGLTWIPPKPLNQNAAMDAADDGWIPKNLLLRGARLATDGSDIICMWSSVWRANGSIGEDADILYSQSGDSGTSWSYPRVLNSNATGLNRNDLVPDILSPSEGTWICIWQTQAFAISSFLGDDIAVSLSTDNAKSWLAIAPINHNFLGEVGINDRPELSLLKGVGYICVWTTTEPEFGGGGGYLGEMDIAYSISHNLFASNEAAIISNTIPVNLAPGATFIAGVTVRNNGNTDWTAEEGYMLDVLMDNCGLLSSNRVELPPEIAVAPGANYQFQVHLAVPPIPGPIAPTTCTIRVQMLHEFFERFGEPIEIKATIAPATNPASAWTIYE